MFECSSDIDYFPQDSKIILVDDVSTIGATANECCRVLQCAGFSKNICTHLITWVKISIFSKPKYSTISAKRKDIPKGTWTKCAISGEKVHNCDLEKNFMVILKTRCHFPLAAHKRIQLLCDDETFREMWQELETGDVLGVN
jgi:hypothetical protein